MAEGGEPVVLISNLHEQNESRMRELIRYVPMHNFSDGAPFSVLIRQFLCVGLSFEQRIHVACKRLFLEYHPSGIHYLIDYHHTKRNKEVENNFTYTCVRCNRVKVRVCRFMLQSHHVSYLPLR